MVQGVSSISTRIKLPVSFAAWAKRSVHAHKVAGYAALTLSLKAPGVAAFIVGAGAAAHLAGVVASYTTLPVIGVPINATSLNGMDALLSTVQMPSGIPVATMAINGAKNAAIFAVEMFSIADDDLKKKLADYREEMVAGVEKKAARVAAQL